MTPMSFYDDIDSKAKQTDIKIINLKNPDELSQVFFDLAQEATAKLAEGNKMPKKGRKKQKEHMVVNTTLEEIFPGKEISFFCSLEMKVSEKVDNSVKNEIEENKRQKTKIPVSTEILNDRYKTTNTEMANAVDNTEPKLLFKNNEIENNQLKSQKGTNKNSFVFSKLHTEIIVCDLLKNLVSFDTTDTNNNEVTANDNDPNSRNDLFNFDFGPSKKSFKQMDKSLKKETNKKAKIFLNEYDTKQIPQTDSSEIADKTKLILNKARKKFMRNVYKICTQPDKELYKILTKMINKPSKCIRTWFMNARAAQKKGGPIDQISTKEQRKKRISIKNQ